MKNVICIAGQCEHGNTVFIMGLENIPENKELLAHAVAEQVLEEWLTVKRVPGHEAVDAYTGCDECEI